VGVSLNKNQIPYDPNPPSAPSGIRVGTPGPSTLGMDEPEMGEIAGIIGSVLRAPQDEDVKADARGRVRGLMSRFPLYP
jgi:glycine hydroxymethyltransferase